MADETEVATQMALVATGTSEAAVPTTAASAPTSGFQPVWAPDFELGEDAPQNEGRHRGVRRNAEGGDRAAARASAGARMGHDGRLYYVQGHAVRSESGLLLLGKEIEA